MMIKIRLSDNQVATLEALEAGQVVNPYTKRSLTRLGFLDRDGEFTPRVAAYRRGEDVFKPVRGGA